MPKEQYDYIFVNKNHIIAEVIAETLTEALELLKVTHYKVLHSFYHMAILQINPFIGSHVLSNYDTVGVYWEHLEDE